MIVNEEFLKQHNIEYRIENGWMIFGDDCDFSEYLDLKFQNNCKFGNWAQFGDEAQFGNSARFGNWAQFDNSARFGDWARFGNWAQFGDESKYRDIEFIKLITIGNIDGSGRNVNVIISNMHIVHFEIGCFFGTIDELEKHMIANNERECKPFYLPILAGVVAGIEDGIKIMEKAK